MSARLTDAVGLVYSRLWNPPQDMMPFGNVWGAVRDAYAGMKRDMAESDVEFYTKTIDFHIRESSDLRMPIPAGDYGYAVRLEYLYDDLRPYGDIPIVSVHNLHGERRVGRMAVVFYGRGPNAIPEMEFSLYSSYRLRLHYEPDVELYPDTEQRVEFRDLYVNYLALKSAVNLLPFYNPPQVDKSLLMQTLMRDLGEWEKAWAVQINKLPGRGNKTIRPATSSYLTRFGRRRGGFGRW